MNRATSRRMGNGRSAVLLLAWLGLTGCGVSQYRIQQAPTVPLHQYPSVIFEPMLVSEWINEDPEARSHYQPYLMRLSPWIPAVVARVTFRRFRRAYEAGEGVLQLRTSLILLEPGSRWTRMVVGFGNGRGAFGVLATLVDSQTQETIGVAEVYGTVSGGWFGGSLTTAYKKCVIALSRFLLDHLELPPG